MFASDKHGFYQALDQLDRDDDVVNHVHSRQNSSNPLQRGEQQLTVPEPNKTSNVQRRPIFTGLVLYFCPNNDKNALRKRRIEKAVANGALWSQNWGTQITHIVADNDVTYEDVKRHLQLEAIPVSSLAYG
jgi:hypothetical protein